MPKIDGGLLICWRQTARKRGSISEEEEAHVQKWYNMIGESEKEGDEKRKMEELHQQRVNQMIKSAERKRWTLA